MNSKITEPATMSGSVYELAQENPLMLQYDSKTSVHSKKSSSCRICLSNILDPAALTCGHKFCERCLETYWDSRDRPDFIVCPLCRTCAFNVNFAKKEPPSRDDFRKTFGVLGDISESDENNSSVSCFRLLSMLVPAIYYLVNWLSTPILELLTFLLNRFSS